MMIRMMMVKMMIRMMVMKMMIRMMIRMRRVQRRTSTIWTQLGQGTLNLNKK